MSYCSYKHPCVYPELPNCLSCFYSISRPAYPPCPATGCANCDCAGPDDQCNVEAYEEAPS